MRQKCGTIKSFAAHEEFTKNDATLGKGPSASETKMWRYKKIMKVLLLDFGTFCDFKLVQVLLAEFVRRGHEIVHVTDSENRALIPMSGVQNVLYTVPHRAKEIMKDPKVMGETADETRSIFSMLRSRRSLSLAYFFMITEKMHLKSIWKEVNIVVIHYPALSFVASMPNDILKVTPLCVFYVAPGFPNKDVPWVLSKRLRDSKFKLRTRALAHENIRSTERLWSMQSLMSGLTSGFRVSLLKIMSEATLIAAWDPVLLPWVRTDLKIEKAGAILDRTLVKTKDNNAISPDAAAFVQKGRVAYLTLGSFTVDVTNIIVGILTMGYRVLYHDTHNVAESLLELKGIALTHADSCLIYKGYLQHETLVPKCSVIVTTGSICVVNIALFAGVPLVHIPILSEQYMWAKNYEKRSGVSFVDVEAAARTPHPDRAVIENTHHALKAIDSEKCRSFTRRVKESVRKRDGVSMIVTIVEKAFSSKRKNHA